MGESIEIPELSQPLDQPYVERQLVVVGDDAMVAASREIAIQELQSKNSIDWAGIAEKVVEIVFPVSGDLITTVAKEAYKSMARARDSGVNVVAISKTEAASLVFPPGHPRDGVLYIGHPAIRNVYYTTAEFHRVTFEHKFSEAVNLLLHLGATEIAVEHLRGWSRDFSANISVPLPSAETSVGVDAGASAKRGESMLFKASLDGGVSPELPDELVWYPHEPTWGTIANARLNFGLREFALSVVYNDDFGVNAGLKLAVSKAGLDLGGKFEDHVSTEWRISGKFRGAETT